MNGSNPPAGGQSDKRAPEPAGRVHPDDATGPHDPVHADPASVAADSAQGVHGADGDSIDVGHGTTTTSMVITTNSLAGTRRG